MLQLIYITNRPEIARIADASGVDWVLVDLEILGKDERQGHLNTVISRHTLADVRAVRGVLTEAKLLVRVNPIHGKSAEELDGVLKAGADIVMLPFFTRPDEVTEFVGLVDGRAKVCLLLETPQAVANLDDILKVDGVDMVHIGLNDLHLGYGMSFMFELLSDGTVEHLCRRLAAAGVQYGFGGIARLGQGDLPAETIVAEHCRLGSSMAILSRSFFEASEKTKFGEAADLFATEVTRIRELEEALRNQESDFFEVNRQRVISAVGRIAERNKSSVMQGARKPGLSIAGSPGADT